MNGMDVLWIPYKVNELTTYISPLKAFEYLAVGKPIISTNLPELQLLGEHVSIIKTPQDAVATLSTVLQNDTLQAKEIRRNAAQEHTWDARVDRIWKTVEANLRQIHEYPH
jgi:glycosyltransferase involved in cell wall biosynthesis